MAATYNYIQQTGVIVPDTGEIKAEVEADFKEAFGQDIDLNPEGPLGIFATADTLSRTAMARNNAALANQINPNQAGGVFLDAIGGLTNMPRRVNTFSQTPVNYTGVAGTIAPLGLRLKNANGDLFKPLAIVTLDSGGNGSVVYQALEPGPIAAPAGTLNTFEVGELGIETATNPTDATLGVLEQSDLSFRSERKITMARQGRSLAEAVTSAVNALDGVKGPCKYRENDTSAIAVIDGVTLNPHSIYVCVSGATDQAVAEALNKAKTGGAGYNNGAPGATPVTITLTDAFSGQIKSIEFDRPALIPILVKVIVRTNLAVETIEDGVKQAILDYSAGTLDPDRGFYVGFPVSCFELTTAGASQVTGIYVKNVLTTKASIINYSNAEIPIEIYQQATITASSISVEVES
jgi:uncharacterized phage protein gp47/JayE